jgi:hypothetical protein
MFDRATAIRHIEQGCCPCERCRGDLTKPTLSKGGWGFCRVCRCAWQVSGVDQKRYAATVPGDRHRQPTAR